MKHTLIALASVLALGSAAQAGSTGYVASSSTVESSPLYKWFVGGSVGYLTDSEEAYYTAHIGLNIAQTGPVTHSLFLEGLYTSQDETFADVDIVPLMLNYKLDYHITPAFSVFGGVGAGAAFINVDSVFGDDDSTEFAAQAFVGVGYDFTPAFQVYTQARWIWIDDTKINGAKVEVGDDIGVEIGARYRF